MEMIGWIGAICFAVCAAPQAWLCYQQGHADGLSKLLLGLWVTGEACSFIYVLPLGKLPLLFNYAANLALLMVILRYKIFPRAGAAVEQRGDDEHHATESGAVLPSVD
jgi:uncharacterized protein with PQ loop repeat